MMKYTRTMVRVRDALLSMQRHSWEQGVCAQAFLESGQDRRAILCAHDAVVRQLDDGRLGVVGTDASIVDAAANGEAVLFAAQATGELRYHQAAQKMLAWLLNPENRSLEGILYHRNDTKQFWVDAFFMAPPFLAASGEYADAIRQIEGFRRRLWNPRARLFSHIWDDGLQEFSRKAFWGSGNGWAVSGMIRVAALLPDEHRADRARILGYVRQTIDGCLAHQRDDGLFHDVVDDPNSFVETNAAQMLAYGIFRLLAMGEIEPRYREPAQRMRLAANAKVDRWGLVQGVCGAPHFDKAGTAPEGQAFYLLMEAAAQKVD